jgi:di/tricarboxylate transporter
MNLAIIEVIFVVGFLMLALYFEWFRPLLAFILAIVFLCVFKILEPKEALVGFSNDQIGVILLLLILSDIINKANVLDLMVKRVFRPGLTYNRFMRRMMIGCSSISAFVNNTPLVAIMLPYVNEWAKRKKISPSKVLLPLSYATMLGGTITLIGTSTNLVVNGLAQEAGKTNPGLPTLGLFDFTPVGLPIAIVGILYLYFIGTKLLPARKNPLEDIKDNTREYIVETIVPSGSKYIGKSIDEASLRNLRGLYIVEIIRHNKVIAPVAPEEIIEENDSLIFAGDVATLIDIVKTSKDLALPKQKYLSGKENLNLVDCVVSNGSSFAGLTVRETNFRTIYDGAIVAISRDGERISGKLGDVIIKSGDVLFVIGGNDFKDLVAERNELFIISETKEVGNLNKGKIAYLLVGTILAFVLPAFDILPLFVTLLILLCSIAIFKIARLNDIKKTVDLDLILILALSLGIGKAISKSGADVMFAKGIIDLVHPIGNNAAVLFGVYVVTNILAMFVTNKAAVAITFPIAISAAHQIGMPNEAMTPFILAVALAGSAEFITPYGYQTNLMVFGPGGYKFKDYIRVGLPLTILYMIVCVGILSYMYNLY